jgi:hypothetical protein
MGIERAFATTLGVTLDELSRSGMAAVRRSTYLPQVTEFDRPDEFARRLTAHDELFEDPWFLAPAISPDGSNGWSTCRSGRLLVRPLAGRRAHGQGDTRLVESARDADFESLRYMNSGAAFSPTAATARVRGEGGWPRRAQHLRRAASPRDPAAAFRPERDHCRRAGRRTARASCSPVWTAASATCSSRTSTAAHALTQDRYADLLPAWSPDGRRIAFTTDRHGSTRRAALRQHACRVAGRSRHAASKCCRMQDEGKNINPGLVAGRPGADLGERPHRYERPVPVRARWKPQTLSHHGPAVRRDRRDAAEPRAVVVASGRLLFTYFENAGYNTYVVEDPRRCRAGACRAGGCSGTTCRLTRRRR